MGNYLINDEIINNNVIAIEIILFKYNYYDNLIYNKILRKCQYSAINDNIIVLDIDEIIDILYGDFNDQLEYMLGLPTEELKSNINSLYFIDLLLNKFKNMKYIRINFSKKRNYSRVLLDENKNKHINFSFKIISSVVNIVNIYKNKSDILSINRLLKKAKILQKTGLGIYRQYSILNASEFIKKLELIEGKISENQADIINSIYDLIDIKTESDNSRLIIISDYVN